jgi:hypothetical protein
MRGGRKTQWQGEELTEKVPEQQNFLWESALLAVIFRFNFKLVDNEIGTRL